jgi:hypothetical protein
MVSQLEQLRSTSIPEMLKTSLQSFSEVQVLLEAWEGWVEEVAEEEDLVMAFLVASVVDQMLHMVVQQMEEELLPSVILTKALLLPLHTTTTTTCRLEGQHQWKQAAVHIGRALQRLSQEDEDLQKPCRS